MVRVFDQKTTLLMHKDNLGRSSAAGLHMVAMVLRQGPNMLAITENLFREIRPENIVT